MLEFTQDIQTNYQRKRMLIRVMCNNSHKNDDDLRVQI